MAAFPQLNAAPELCTNHLQGTPSFACLFYTQFGRRSHDLPALGRRRYTTRTAVTCSNDGGSNSSDDRLFRPLARPDRREVVLGGLGGLAGLGLDRTAAFAIPIAPPDLSKCHSATLNDEPKGEGITLECCPPFSDKAIDFTLPKVSKLRVRPAAHKVDKAYEQKFERAIKLMKDLPGDDPRNFYQQANVHCAYCNDAYDQVGVPNAHKDQRHIQVHYCWLFFPFHRIQLYYWERILGKLIGDDNFAIPFWNWDHPEGMEMPSIYTNLGSPLFNPNRNPEHLPPTTAILNYDDKSPTYDDRNRQIQENLNVMYRQMVLQGKNADLFMGARYVTEQAKTPEPKLTSGSLELTPHNNLHSWSGNPANDFREDMGNFYSAGRDCLFYGLHANVDRMWDVWTKTLKRKNFDDPDWLNAAFYFYDENKQLVRVKVSDCLCSEMMGFTYEQRDLPWLVGNVPVRKSFESIEKAKKLATKTLAQFPLTLTSTVSTLVTRPKTSRSAREKEAAEEVLVISGIQVEKTIAAKFDVFVNAPKGEDLTASAAEFAGSFTNVILKKQKGANAKPLTINLRLDVTDLLDIIGADGDDTIVVTLVPRQGTEKVRIQGVGIEFIKNF